MIIEVRAKNCFAFENNITFSMKADMRNKNLIPMFIKKTILIYLKLLEYMDLTMPERPA